MAGAAAGRRAGHRRRRARLSRGDHAELFDERSKKPGQPADGHRRPRWDSSGLTMALIGLYAIVAYQVSRRTREIGIRMAIGAMHGQVLRMVLRQAGVMGVTGVAIGTAISFAAGQGLTSALGSAAIRSGALCRGADCAAGDHARRLADSRAARRIDRSTGGAATGLVSGGRLQPALGRLKAAPTYALCPYTSGDADRGAPRRDRPILGLHVVPSAAARSDGGGALGPRLDRGAADRRRQVALLPGARGGVRHRPGGGGVAAHLADEGPGGHAGRQRRARRALQQLARRRREGGGDARARRAALPAALRLAGAARRRRRRRLPGAARRVRRALHRRGRGPLHQPVGPRLPPRIPAAGAAARPAARRVDARLHGHRHGAGAPRHRLAAGAARSHRAGGLVRPAQPGLPRAATGLAEGAAPRRDRAARERGGHHLLLVAARGGRAGGVALGLGHAGAALPRRAVGRGARLEPGCVPERARRSHRGHRGLRHGHRPVQRALRGARRGAAVARALPAGVGPRGPRRARGGVRARELGGRLRALEDDARAERRAHRRARGRC